MEGVESLWEVGEERVGRGITKAAGTRPPCPPKCFAILRNILHKTKHKEAGTTTEMAGTGGSTRYRKWEVQTPLPPPPNGY